MGGTIQAQSAGQPPLAFCSFSRCFMKEEVAAWWSTMVTLASWGEGVGMGLDSAYGPYPCHPKPYCAPCHLKPNKYYVLINPHHPLTAAHSSARAPSPRSETLETPERHSAGTVSPKLPCSACPQSRN